MARYSICNLTVETPLLPSSYQPFMLHENLNSEKIGLTISETNSLPNKETLAEVVELSNMVISKETFLNGRSRWVYEARNGTCTILVDADYNHAEYLYPRILTFFDKMNISEIISPYFQILFECKLVQTGFTTLHSACVELNGVAYAFSGPSGVGKSSRAQKWCKVLSAEWISGDRPAINVEQGLIYGVPWDGKEGIYRNVNYPLAAIFKVTRSKTTQIKDMTWSEKMHFLFEQTFFPLWDTNLAGIALSSLKKIINQIPIFELCCDITDESTYKAFEIISKTLSIRR